MEYLFSWLGGRGKKFKFNLRSLNFMLQKTERFKEQIDVVELERRIILASEFWINYKRAILTSLKIQLHKASLQIPKANYMFKIIIGFRDFSFAFWYLDN